MPPRTPKAPAAIGCWCAATGAAESWRSTARLLSDPGSAGGVGARRRHPLADRGVLPIQQGTRRPGPASDPPLGLLASLDGPGDARPRVSVGDDCRPAAT